MSETSVGYTTLFGTDAERLAFQLPEKTPKRGFIWITPEGKEYRSIGARWHELTTATKSQSFDFEGKQAMNTVFGEVTTAERTDRINTQFQYNISDKDVVKDATGTGVVQHAGESRAEVRSGSGIGFAEIKSIDAIRYVPGKEMVANLTADFDPPEANLDQFAGVHDGQNGFAAGYRGTDYGILFTRGGVDEFIALNAPDTDTRFNVKPSWFEFDPEKYRIYKISYGWLGVAPAIISVYGGYQYGWVPIHVIDYSGQTGPHLLNPVLPIRVWINRSSGSGADVGIRTSSWRGGIVGKSPAGSGADRTFQKILRAKAIAGGNVLVPIISIRNKTTFQGLTNNVRARYGTVTMSTDGTKDVIITVYRNGTLTGASFADVDADNSTCEYDTSATAYTPSDEPIGGTIMGKVDKVRINLFENDVVIPIRPGETVTLCADSANSSEMNIFLRHIEEF